MRYKEKKNSAFLESLHREGGFTFISTIFMLFILSFSLPFLGHLIKVAGYGNNYEELSINQFYQFMRDDLIRAVRTNVIGNKLYLGLDDDGVEIAIYEKYGNSIRRQVNGRGHEIYLQNVDDIIFTQLRYGVKIKLISKSGAEYDKSIVLYEW